MFEQHSQKILIGTFFLACATIAWTDIKNSKVPPPFRFIAAGLVYGILAVAGGFLGGSTVALAGVGYYLVLLYKYFGADLVTEGATSVGAETGDAIGAATDAAKSAQPSQHQPSIIYLK